MMHGLIDRYVHIQAEEDGVGQQVGIGGKRFA